MKKLFLVFLLLNSTITIAGTAMICHETGRCELVITQE